MIYLTALCVQDVIAGVDYLSAKLTLFNNNNNNNNNNLITSRALFTFTDQQRLTT